MKKSSPKWDISNGPGRVKNFHSHIHGQQFAIPTVAHTLQLFNKSFIHLSIKVCYQFFLNNRTDHHLTQDNHFNPLLSTSTNPSSLIYHSISTSLSFSELTSTIRVIHQQPSYQVNPQRLRTH